MSKSFGLTYPGIYRLTYPGIYSLTYPEIYSLTYPGIYSLTYPGIYSFTYPGIYRLTYPGIYSLTYTQYGRLAGDSWETSGRHLQASVAAGLDLGGLRPVSYTHLTLPTICSV